MTLENVGGMSGYHIYCINGERAPSHVVRVVTEYILANILIFPMRARWTPLERPAWDVLSSHCPVEVGRHL